jgi:hypothetical protein
VGRDLVAASARLEAVESRSEVDQAQLREAALALGQALLCRELYAPAFSFFEVSLGRRDTMASLGRARQRVERSGYLPAVRWLVLLARRFPHWDDLLAAWGTYLRIDIERPELADIRDELYFQLGRTAYVGGAPALFTSAGFKPAAALLAQVAPSSPFYVKAKLFEGACRVREYDARHAVAAFKEARRAASVGGAAESTRLRDLATISLARTFFSTGQLEVATREYAQIPPASPYRVESEFEAAWTRFRAGDHPGAIAHLDALDAQPGTLAPHVLGEALLMRATMSELDGFDFQATNQVQRSMDILQRLQARIRRVLSVPPRDDDLFPEDQRPSDDALYALATELRAGREGPKSDLAGATRWAFASGRLQWQFDYIDELSRELSLLEGMEPLWRQSRTAAHLRTDLTERRLATTRELGNLFGRRLIRESRELGLLIRRLVHPSQYEPLGERAR